MELVADADRVCDRGGVVIYGTLGFARAHHPFLPVEFPALLPGAVGGDLVWTFAAHHRPCVYIHPAVYVVRNAEIAERLGLFEPGLNGAGGAGDRYLPRARGDDLPQRFGGETYFGQRLPPD